MLIPLAKVATITTSKAIEYFTAGFVLGCGAHQVSSVAKKEVPEKATKNTTISTKEKNKLVNGLNLNKQRLGLFCA